MSSASRRTRGIVLTSLLALMIAGAASAAPSPAELMVEYHATLRGSTDDAAIWPYYVDAARGEFQRKFPPELRGRAFYMMKTTSPAQVRVVSQTIDGEQAVVTLRPVGGDERLIGTANLHLQGGEWKLEKVVWQHQ